MKTTKLLSIVILMVIAFSCDNVKEWTDPIDNTIPERIIITGIENLHGGAMISYTMPYDPNNQLMGVKAVYSLREGEQEYEIFSSALKDTIILRGFADTKEHVVNLYTVSKSMIASEPRPVTIQPLTPPVDLVRQTLKVNETFGGLYCSWENDMQENIAVSLYVDSVGEMTLDDTYFSNAEKVGYSFRGFPSKELSFRIEIRDRWMNYSAPLDTVLTPMYEQQIKGRDDNGIPIWSQWGFDTRECLERGDTYATLGLRVFTTIFDEIIYTGDNWWHSGDDAYDLRHYVTWPEQYFVLPAYWSIDLGKPSTLSRFKIFMRPRTPWFSAAIFTVFELWGTNNPKALESDRMTNLLYWTGWPEIGGTDAWKDDWVQLGNYNIVLPSGATTTTDVLTDEDIEYVQNGFDFMIDSDKTNVPCRYVRFVMWKSNEATRQIKTQISELQFFGDYAK